jgi:hypothetical protein
MHNFYTNEQRYICGGKVYSVDVAKRIAATRPTTEMPVEKVRALASAMPPQSAAPDDAEIDVTIPIITGVVDGSPVIIDGKKRVRRAAEMGVGLPMIDLSEKETGRCLVCAR